MAPAAVLDFRKSRREKRGMNDLRVRVRGECPAARMVAQSQAEQRGLSAPAALPTVQPFGVAADAHRSAEELTQTFFGEELVARAIGNDAAVAHQDDALDFGEDIAEVMCHHHEAGALARKAAQGLAQLALRGQVERVRGLVEKELPRPVDEGARDKDAAFFAGGHGADVLRGQPGCFHPLEGLTGAVPHGVGDMQIGPQRGCGEEAGDHGVEAGGDGGALTGQLGAHRSCADDAEVTAQLGQIPAFTAKDADAHAWLHDGVDLAGDGEDECGFSAPVGAENGNMLAGANAEVDVVKHDAVAARDIDLAQFEKFGAGLDGFHFDTRFPPLPARLNGSAP